MKGKAPLLINAAKTKELPPAIATNSPTLPKNQGKKMVKQVARSMAVRKSAVGLPRKIDPKEKEAQLKKSIDLRERIKREREEEKERLKKKA